MRKIPPFLRDELKNYFHKGNILGPTAMDDVKNIDVRKEIFEYHSRIYEKGIGDPSLIIGRRGSGKTAYLQFLEDSNRYGLIVRLKKDDAMSEIIQQMESANIGASYVEQIARLWLGLLYIAVIAEMNKAFPNIIAGDEDLVKIRTELGLNDTDSPISLIHKILKRAAQRSQEGWWANVVNLLESLLSIKQASIEFLEEKISKICKCHKLKILISIDSLEEYDITDYKKDSALKGFLKAVGHFNNVRNGIRIRCCLPSETYAHLLNISSNPDKDFPSSMTLHWRAKELLSLLAHRIAIHMELYGDGPDADIKTALAIDRTHPAGVNEFLDLALGTVLINENGNTEKPIFFLLRHTQMIPRHLVMLLNDIMRDTDHHFHRKYFDVPDSIIKNIVASRSNEISNGIINAYRYVYPNSEKTLKTAVAHLPSVFSESDMDKVFSRRLKSIENGSQRNSSDILEMLIRTGCVGRVLDSDERYVRGLFEYNARVPPFSEQDKFCVHPMFKCSQALMGLQGNHSIIAIHPVGAHPDDDYHGMN